MRKATILEIASAIVVLVLLCIIGIQLIKIKNLHANSISLYNGESIPDLGLMSLKGEPLDKKIFSHTMNKVTMLCLFQTPCSGCSKAIGPWKALVNFFGDRIAVIGIIPDNQPASFNFNELEQLNFTLYQPTH